MIPTASWRAAFAAALLLGACSPVFNWREVPIGGDGDLVALLPCKPDRASRDLPLAAGEAVTVRMIGCEAGGATFAVALASAPDPAQAEAWLAAWQRQARTQWAAGRIEEHAATVAQAAPMPAPWRLEATADAGPSVRQVWFAHRQRNGAISLYQATVLGAPSAPEASQTFFEGLRLP